jgi:hypothetical protein
MEFFNYLVGLLARRSLSESDLEAAVTGRADMGHIWKRWFSTSHGLLWPGAVT